MIGCIVARLHTGEGLPAKNVGACINNNPGVQSWSAVLIFAPRLRTSQWSSLIYYKALSIEKLDLKKLGLSRNNLPIMYNPETSL